MTPTQAQTVMVGHLARQWLDASDDITKPILHAELGGFLRGIRSVDGETNAVRKLEAKWTSITGTPPYPSATPPGPPPCGACGGTGNGPQPDDFICALCDGEGTQRASTL